ncbi:Bug family tripartite tricarboxylate transporter substrate binding protein [Pelagibacterium lacus]|uniref:Tripartite tricarboxylate transporter substrate binding protein n=1 Tax=Pelagibacterium lacus TaxID=2282655 RepID=A0A369W3T6_9HYPH|nr:tripartite tricarboxylate transporter substrate binding protein [Pelagibacterium lacus]RDE08699.1 tripartite tricarboxylate transporter substrate binding protein [Pelagibacterium lacus]
MKNLFASFAFATALVASGGAGAQDFPSKPIEISVWASAGGGTDGTNRLLAQAMQEELGMRINVVNRTGGGGGVAMSHVWNQPHDGYSWLGASEGMQLVKAMEYFDKGTSDWRWYMIIGGTPGVISVPQDSPYQTLEDLLQAARDEPGSVTVGHCPLGCVWHMRALALGLATDADFTYVPYDGTAPAHVAALSREVDAVVSGVGEQAEYLRAGTLRPLAMIEHDDYVLDDLDPIPAAGKEYPGIDDIPASMWLGMAIPKDTDPAIVAIIDEAFEVAVQSEAIKAFADERRMIVSGMYGEEAEARLQIMESALAAKLYELSMIDKSPEELGIPSVE